MTENENAWPALKRLHEMPLPQQRRLLRLHEETGFGTEDRAAIRFREELDLDLGRISEMEFRAQCDPSGAGRDEDAIPYFADLLKGSPSFVQYLNFYLYFNVRFAAGRIVDPRKPRVIDDSDCNETEAALPPAPMCQDAWNNNGVGDEFLRLARHDDSINPLEARALRFLDGFSEDGEKSEVHDPADSEESRFELWLRRLYFGGRQEGYFDEVAKGITGWALGRY